MDTITKNEIKRLLPKRPADSHKGSFGKVLIVAGSPMMMGAAILSARAALRSGAGLVRVSVPEKLFHIVQLGAPEAVCCGRNFVTDSDFLNDNDAIVIGPGLGIGSGSASLVKYLLSSYEGKLLLDADALNVIAKGGIDVSSSSASCVITPHAGEAARLLDSTPEEINSDREMFVLELAKKFNCIAVLKGNHTVIAEPGGDIAINYTGNPGMATAGSGDVLSGMMGAFMGEGMSVMDAASAAVFTHGLAGDIAEKEMGTYGLIASDIIDTIPKSILDIQEILHMI